MNQSQNKTEISKEENKIKKKNTISYFLLPILSLFVVVCSVLFYLAIQQKNDSSLKFKSTQVPHNEQIQKQNIQLQYMQQNGLDGKEYELLIPTLQETQHLNNILFNETINNFKRLYNIQNATELSVLLDKVGILFNILEKKPFIVSIELQIIQKKNTNLLNPFFGIFRENFYCIKSDLYHFTHEKEFYQNITLFSDWQDKYTRDNIFANFSQVASQMYGLDLPQNYFQEESFALEYNISQYYLQRDQFQNSFIIGSQLGCLFQGFSKIPNSGAFTSKDGLVNTYQNFLKSIDEMNKNQTSLKRYSQKCIKEFNFIPKTYNLNYQEECKQFFDYIQSEEFIRKTKDEGFQFISKLGANVHQGKGINIVSQEILEAVLNKYNSGKLCGNLTEDNAQLIQQYLNNPLLLNGIKFEIRMHFVIASVNPLIIYAQDKGGVSLCGLKYNAHDSQIQRHICVYDISRRLLELSDQELFKISGKTREQFMSSFSYQLTLENLQQKLEKQGSIPPNWIQDNFIPSVFRNFIHTVLMTRDKLVVDQRFYEMYASDILIDKSTMRPYILQYNTNPRMVNTSDFVHDWNLSTIKDAALISMSQIRSRYYRIKKIFNEYINELKDKQQNPNQSQYLQKLINANNNRVEPQFNIDEKLTSYVKIYDETDPKELYYKGNLIFDKECSH